MHIQNINIFAYFSKMILFSHNILRWQTQQKETNKLTFFKIWNKLNIRYPWVILSSNWNRYMTDYPHPSTFDKELTDEKLIFVAKLMLQSFDKSFRDTRDPDDDNYTFGTVFFKRTHNRANSNMRCDSFKSHMIINKLSKFL